MAQISIWFNMIIPRHNRPAPSSKPPPYPSLISSFSILFPVPIPNLSSATVYSSDFMQLLPEARAIQLDLVQLPTVLGTWNISIFCRPFKTNSIQGKTYNHVGNFNWQTQQEPCRSNQWAKQPSMFHQHSTYLLESWVGISISCD